MNRTPHFFFQLIVLLFFTNVCSQIIKTTVVDNETGENIPYAIATVDDILGVSADGNGYIEIELPDNLKKTDTLKFISIGYKAAKFALSGTLNIHETTKLKRDILTMKEVVISNTTYGVEEILEKVTKGISKNYDFTISKRNIFFRQHDTNKINHLNIQFKKSTIPEIDQNFVNKELAQIPKSSSFYTEVLADLYQHSNHQKLDIIKAVKFYDTYSNNYLDVFNTKLEEILNKNFKKDSYFKIKSGLFSIKTDGKEFFSKEGELLDMRNELSKKEEINKNFFLNNTKKVISNIMDEIFYTNSSSLNFITKKSRYNFELIDTIPYGDDFVYKISFFPNRGEDFKGTFYVNTSNFAVVRIDYQNVAHLRDIKLFGISYQELGRKGTLIFEKNKTSKYQLKLIDQIQEDAYGINRPLKIIEKNKYVKGKRKQNEIASDVNFASTVIRKFQILVYDTKHITEYEYQNLQENKKDQPKNWIKYYDDFWKDTPRGYNFSVNFNKTKSL